MPSDTSAYTHHVLLTAFLAIAGAVMLIIVLEAIRRARRYVPPVGRVYQDRPVVRMPPEDTALIFGAPRYTVPRFAEADGTFCILDLDMEIELRVMPETYTRRSSALRAARRLNAKAAG